MNTHILAETSDFDTQRYTFRPEYEQNPMTYLLDLFPGGFEVEDFDTELFAVKVHADFVVPEDLENAISDTGGEIPAKIFWAYADFGKVCVRKDWVEPLREAIPSDCVEVAA